MARPVALLTWGNFYGPGWIERHWPLLLERCEVRLIDEPQRSEWLDQIAQTDVVIARRWDINRESMQAADRLRGVVTVGVGVEMIDVAAAMELGIVVANSPGNYIAVAESTLLLMAAVAKRLPAFVEAARSGRRPDSNETGIELHGKTLGLVGYGRIGRQVAGLARAYGMTVLAYDPYLQSAGGAELVSLEDLLRRSDFVSLHPVLTPETYHLIRSEQLALMKPTAYLINTSRGGVIDEPALIEALRAGRIAGAGLDVFEPEPPSLDNPLLGMPNVVCTPHSAARTPEALRRCAEMTQESVLALLDGRLPEYTINREVRWRVLI